MKQIFHQSVVCVLLVALGILSGCGKREGTKSERKVLYYQSAMHPWIKSDKPGRCTICGMELTPVYEGEAGFDTGGDVISLSSNSVRVLNVQTAEVKTQALAKTLAVAGVIDDDDSRHRVLSAYVGGRIDKLYVSFVGAEVKASEPLADFYSPMLLQTEREYRAVSSRTGVFTKTNFQTGDKYPSPGLSATLSPSDGERDGVRGGTEINLGTQHDAELRMAVASRLRQMGLTPEQIEALPAKPADALTSQILAPVSGTVVEKNVYAGQYVQEGEKLFEIADFATMWFQFRAYEQDLPWIHVGQKVDVTTPSHSDYTFTGHVAFIDPTLDGATRSAKVRVELANPPAESGHRMMHRLYADGVVHLEAPEVLAVPRSAIIQTGPQAVAFVDQGGGGYARRVLQLGRRGDVLVEILGGLSAGEKVVVNGNLLIDGQAEMNRSFATHAPTTEATNQPSTLPPLTDAQRKAVSDYLALADALGAALAADDVKEFNAQAARTHAAMPMLLDAFAGASAWQALLQPIEQAGHLGAADNLSDARRMFHPFSEAIVALAQAARRADKEFANVKVFRCPMTKDAFPGAPNRADWIQLQPGVRNPWFGQEMLDCGSEVKP
jgi:Cu(I)/Ag(I) efflux system membrane fusion protein